MKRCSGPVLPANLAGGRDRRLLFPRRLDRETNHRSPCLGNNTPVISIASAPFALFRTEVGSQKHNCCYAHNYGDKPYRRVREVEHNSPRLWAGGCERSTCEFNECQRSSGVAKQAAQRTRRRTMTNGDKPEFRKSGTGATHHFESATRGNSEQTPKTNQSHCEFAIILERS